MSDRYREEKKPSAAGRLIRLIQKYRLVFIILAAGAVLFPVVYYIVDTVNQRTTAEGANMMDELDTKNDEYRKIEDKEKKASAEKELFALIDQAADRFRGRYAAAYALLMRVNVNYQKITALETTDKKELILTVLRDLSRVVDTTDDNILVPVALKHLATFVQNLAGLAPAASGGGSAVGLDDVLKIVPPKTLGADKAAKTEDVAFDLYRYLVDRFPKSLYTAEALFAMGFMLEAKGDNKTADDLYGRLESEYGNNLWTKMAINRKIALEAGGLVAK